MLSVRGKEVATKQVCRCSCVVKHACVVWSGTKVPAQTLCLAFLFCYPGPCGDVTRACIFQFVPFVSSHWFACMTHLSAITWDSPPPPTCTNTTSAPAGFVCLATTARL